MMESENTIDLDARLLIIDDNPDITDILEEVGQEAGFEVRCAHDLEAMKVAYTEFDPLVILLDLGLGGDDSDDDEMLADGDDGLKVLQYLSEQQSQASIVIISGMSRRKRELTQYQGQDLNLRVLGHLPKPFDIDNVQETLVKLRHSSVQAQA